MSHWSEGVCESVIRRDNDGALNIRIRGGAEDGTFPYFGPVESNKVRDTQSSYNLLNLLDKIRVRRANRWRQYSAWSERTDSGWIDAVWFEHYHRIDRRPRPAQKCERDERNFKTIATVSQPECYERVCRLRFTVNDQVWIDLTKIFWWFFLFN